MDEEPGARPVEQPVLVEVTPSHHRWQAVGCLGVGLLLAALAVVLLVVRDRLVISPVPVVAALAHGSWCAVRARRQVSDTLLRMDRSGLRTGDGLHDHDWAGVVLVRVGSRTGLRLPLVSQPFVHVFTEAGVELARRAATPLQARYSIPVSGLLRVRDLCQRLRTLTDARVVDSTRMSLRAAAASFLRDQRG